MNHRMGLLLRQVEGDRCELGTVDLGEVCFIVGMSFKLSRICTQLSMVNCSDPGKGSNSAKIRPALEELCKAAYVKIL
jgi:hypothetical protein